MNREEIIKQLIPEEIIDHISNNEIRCHCPFHPDNRYSFSINLKTGLFDCQTCEEKGNLQQFITKMSIYHINLTPVNNNNIQAICMFDNEEYTEKPTNLGAIKNRIPNLKIKKYTIKEIQKNIIKGQTLIPAGIKGNTEKNWKGQQIFCMDFDNSEMINKQKVNYSIGSPLHFSIDQMKKYCEDNNIVPTFMYKTFSYTEQQHKYRLVYVFDRPITDITQAKQIVEKLFYIFRDFRPDAKPKNLSSCFLGGKEIVFENNIVYKCEYTDNIDLKNLSIVSSLYDDKGNFAFDKLAQTLLKEHSIIKLDDNLHIYTDGIYVYNTSLIEKLMFKYISIRNTSRQEVLKYLNLFAEEKEESSAYLIPVKNGIVDLKKGQLLDFDKNNYIFKTKINHNFVVPTDENNYKIVTEFFNKISCNNEEIKQLLFEIIGYCLYRKCSFKKIFIILGDGNNGKSPYMKLIMKTIGENNATSLSMQDITENGRFKLAELYGKLVNIADDETETDIVNSGLIKRLSAGGKVNVEKKGKDPFEFYNYAKFVISFNDNVRFNDTSFGFNERLIVVPFNCKILPTDNDYKENFEELLFTEENLEYVLFKSVQAFKKVLENGRFTINEEVNKAKDLYLYDNNHVLQYLSAHPINTQKRTSDTYDLYTKWCIQNGIKPKTSNEFGKELKKLGYESKRIQKANKRDFYYVKMT